jgi:hypothetical protein
MMSMSFTAVNPATIAWIDQHAVTLLEGIAADSVTAQQIRFIIEQGAMGQWDVRYMAELITDWIGLTERDIRALANFAAGFGEDLDDRAMRLIGRYRDRLLRARAETIARTETINAANRGTQDLWQQALDDGTLPPDAMQTWIVTPDGRLCSRCAAMEGVQAEVGGLFPGDGDGPTLHPRCRCTVGLRFD